MRSNRGQPKKDPKSDKKAPEKKAPEKKVPEKKAPEKKAVPEKKPVEKKPEKKVHLPDPKKPATTTTAGAGKKVGTGTTKKETSTISTSSTRPTSGKPDTKKPTTKTSSKTLTKSKSKPKVKSVDAQAKFPKFMQLIERRKIFSGQNVVLKKRFMQWKNLMLLQKSMVREKTSKTIVTKKRLNIHRIKRPEGQGQGEGTAESKETEDTKASGASSTELGKVEDKKEGEATESTIKQEGEKQPVENINLSKEERNAKLKKFVEGRMNAYENNNNIIKRFFFKWQGKKMLGTRTVTKSNLKKKKIYLIKERSKNLFEEKGNEPAAQKEEEFKEKMNKALRPSFSITGNKVLTEKLVQINDANKSSKNLTQVDPRKSAKFIQKARLSKSTKSLPQLQVEEVKKDEKESKSKGKEVKDKDKEGDKLKEALDKNMGAKKSKKVFRLRPEANKAKITNLLNKFMKRKIPLEKYFKLWKVPHEKQVLQHTDTSTHKIIKKSKIKLVRDKTGKDGKETESQPDSESVQTTEETVVEPKEDELKLKTNTAKTKETHQDIIKAQKKERVKHLVLNISRNMLIKHFNKWKQNMGHEDLNIRTGERKTLIKKKVINLSKRKPGEKEVSPAEMKELNLEIPTCPVSTTTNYIINVNNLSLIQYHPFELYSIPQRETILKNNIEIKLQGPPGKRKVVVERKKNIRAIFVKYLILYHSKGLLIKYFNKWKYKNLPLKEIEEIINKNKKRIIATKRLKLKQGPRALDEEIFDLGEPGDDSINRKGKTIKKPGESDDEDQAPKSIADAQTGQYYVTKKPKTFVPEKTSIIKTLILNRNKNVLVKFFNNWKNKLTPEELETIKKGQKKTVIKKRVINLQKKKKDGKEEIVEVEEKEPTNLNLEIPVCPVSTTPNYLKDVYNLPLIQYNPEDIYIVPRKESILKNIIIIMIVGPPGKRRPVVVKGRNGIRKLFIKYLILILTKGLLIRYFNRWKYRKLAMKEIEEIIRNKKRNIIATKRVNIKRTPGEGGEEILEIGEPGDNRYAIKRKGKIIKHKGEPGEEGLEVYEIIEGPDGKKLIIKRKGKIIRYRIPGKPGEPSEPGEEDEEEYEEVEGPDGKKIIIKRKNN